MAKESELEAYLKAFAAVDGQKGLLVMIGGKAVGFDLVSRPEAYARLTTTVKHYTAVMPETLRAGQARLLFRDALSDVPDTYHGRAEGDSGRKAKGIKLFAEGS